MKSASELTTELNFNFNLVFDVHKSGREKKGNVIADSAIYGGVVHSYSLKFL